VRLLTQGEAIKGLCTACGATLTFTPVAEADFDYYEADEIVNRWMDHQLNDCPSVIDNPGGIS
jgi:hypothetical protein